MKFVVWKKWSNPEKSTQTSFHSHSDFKRQRNTHCTVIVCVCVFQSTHCTITCFGFRTRRIDGVECGLFSIHAPLGQTTLRVGRVSV